MKCVCKKSLRTFFGTFKVGETYVYHMPITQPASFDTFNHQADYVVYIPYIEAYTNRDFHYYLFKKEFDIYFSLDILEEEWEDISEDEEFVRTFPYKTSDDIIH